MGFQITPVVTYSSRYKLLHNSATLECILVTDGKYIIEFDYRQEIENAKIALTEFLDVKQTINALYVEKYDIYFILFEGWKLYILRRNLQIIKSINFDSKYILGMYYYKDIEAMLLFGVDIIEQIHLQINTNVKQTKFLSSIKLEIEKVKKTHFNEAL